jgi:excisionase family DNA binding protein
MTTPAVIVHHPIPDDLRTILAQAGYQPQTTNPDTTTFTHQPTTSQANHRQANHRQAGHAQVVWPSRTATHPATAEAPVGTPSGIQGGDSGPGTGRLLLSPAEAAHALGISRSGLYVLLAKGHLNSVRIGTSRKIPTDDLAAYIQTLKNNAEALHTAL